MEGAGVGSSKDPLHHLVVVVDVSEAFTKSSTADNVSQTVRNHFNAAGKEYVLQQPDSSWASYNE